MSTEERKRNPLLIIIIIVVAIIVLPLLWILFGRNLLGGAAQTPVAEEAVPFLPPPPSNIHANHVPVFDVFVEWQDNSDNEDGFYIYREAIGEGEEPILVGTVGEDEVEFLDTGTSCGEIYHYTVASFNAAGESPATPCWDIVMPLCPLGRDITFGVGANDGYDFLLGMQSAMNDLYLGTSDDGQAMFMANLPWQRGLLDLGETAADIPLDQTDMPADPTYLQDGVPAVAGHRYIAQAIDGVHLILFDLTGLGEMAGATYILWTPRSIIDVSPCEVAVGGYTPGGGCVAGDGICDRTCPAGDVDCGGVPPGSLGGIAGCEAACGDGVCQEECFEECATCPMDCRCGARFVCRPLEELCGDGMCIPGCDENCATCPDDCPCGGECATASCGDGVCQAECSEECATCPADCPCGAQFGCIVFEDGCGDGICDPACDETCETCPEDCPCGGDCSDVACGDGLCVFECGEDCRTCLEDCYSICGATAGVCGDGYCGAAIGEDPCTCPEDCPVVCGDGHCTGGTLVVTPLGSDCSPEDCLTCSEDCGACPHQATQCGPICGDGICDTDCLELAASCPEDCGAQAISTGGDCGAPCEASEQCLEGLACFEGTCWEDCRCEGQCGEGATGRGSGTTCRSCGAPCEEYCNSPDTFCDDGCCRCP